MPRPQQFNAFDVIDAAISYFGEYSYLNASLWRLVLHTDVSCGSLYTSFGDRKSLFRHAPVQSMDRSFISATHCDQHQPPPFHTIVALLR